MEGVSSMTKEYYIKPGFYQHCKGMYYNVIGVVRNSETLHYKVLYQALYGDCGLCDRPFEMFKENVVRDGQTIPRFKFIADKVTAELLDQIREVKSHVKEDYLLRLINNVES